MAEKGKYIYSVIKDSNPPTTLPDGSRDPYGNREFGPIGINNQEVSLIYYKDIAAVVSSTPVINFDRLSKEELTEYVATHQRVNEILMKDYDVCPMAFGLIAQNQDELLKILEKAYLQFKVAFKKITGKIEFAVQIFWDEKKFLKKLVNTDAEIKRLSDEAKSPLKGIAAKLKLGKLIFETLERKRREYLEDVENFLKECSLDFRPGRILEENMIGNISVIIEKKAESEFDKRMQELGQKYGDDLRFKYIGPMPPYSFVNINFSLGNFELVNEARKLLGLGEEATLEEIKKAYYELAHRYHPDKFQGNEAEMKKLSQAYNILENYCQSCDEFRGKIKGRKYSFKEKDVKNTLIIK